MSRSFSGAIKAISQANLNNSQICDLRTGKVTSVNPLKVQISTELTIPESLLIVPEHLTDYEVEVLIDKDTETKPMIIHGALKVGDKIALIRKHGGQSYFILDRI